MKKEIKTRNKIITYTLALGFPLALLVSGGNAIRNIASDKWQNLNRLEQIADKNKDGELSIKEKYEMYKICGVENKSPYYNLTSEDIQKGLNNYKIKSQN